MIDRILSKFFEFIDNQIQKIEDVLTFDVGQFQRTKYQPSHCKSQTTM